MATAATSAVGTSLARTAAPTRVAYGQTLVLTRPPRKRASYSNWWKFRSTAGVRPDPMEECYHPKTATRHGMGKVTPVRLFSFNKPRHGTWTWRQQRATAQSEINLLKKDWGGSGIKFGWESVRDLLVRIHRPGRNAMKTLHIPGDGGECGRFYHVQYDYGKI